MSAGNAIFTRLTEDGACEPPANGGWIGAGVMTFKLMLMAAIYCVMMLGPALARLSRRAE